MTAKSDPSAAGVGARDEVSAAATVKVGRLTADSVPGSLIVDFEGNPRGPLAARSVVALDQSALSEAIARRQQVALLFENGDPRLPIVVGLVAPEPGAALLGALLSPSAASTPASTPASTLLPAGQIEARVDGRRVVLEGTDEVVLKCGEASITLKRDGKVIVRGAYVETHAKGVNRIKGGSVKIN